MFDFFSRHRRRVEAMSPQVSASRSGLRARNRVIKPGLLYQSLQVLNGHHSHARSAMPGEYPELIAGRLLDDLTQASPPFRQRNHPI
jgi:hypothetical protein